jgi:hypothetical protein
MGGLRTLWSRRFQVLATHERIQTGDKNVVKVIIKLIEGEEMASQKKERWWDRSTDICFKEPI